jgi:hypothetical protein
MYSRVEVRADFEDRRGFLKDRVACLPLCLTLRSASYASIVAVPLPGTTLPTHPQIRKWTDNATEVKRVRV